MSKIYIPLALKLHAFGLTNLHDPNWTGCVLFDKLKQHVRQRIEPKDMLFKTIKNGLLYHLGLWILEDYFNFDKYLVDKLKDEYRFWYLEDYVEALNKFDIKFETTNSIKKAKQLIIKINSLYDISNDQKYFNYLDSEEGLEQILLCCNNLHKEFRMIIPVFIHLYAIEYAERVFHDRQLCAFVSELLVAIGFDGMDSPEEEKPKQWIERQPLPKWAIKTIRARDRGHCTECGCDLTLELQDDENIDHIVPLSKAGTNDLVNLQLLCKTCNLKKYNNLKIVRTSIPDYLKSLKCE